MRCFLAFAFAFAGVFASAQLLTKAGFEEEEDYEPGALQGQTDWPWIDDSFIGAYRVQRDFARSGRQAVAINTASIGTTRAWRSLAAASYNAGSWIIVASVDAYVAPDPLGRPLSYAGLDAYQARPFDRIGAIRFRPNSGTSIGRVEMLVNNQMFIWPVAIPEQPAWYHMVLLINLDTGQFAGNFDGFDVFVQAPLLIGPSWVPEQSRLWNVDLYTAATGYNWVYYDNFRLEAVPAGTIRGQVTLGDWDRPLAGIPIVAEIREGFVTRQVTQTTLDEDGYFYVSTPLRGQYELFVKGPHWLNRRGERPVRITDFGAHYMKYHLVNGDCNDDNVIDIGDFGMLSFAFGSDRGDPNFLDGADLNGDDSVDVGDFSILSQNFDREGD